MSTGREREIKCVTIKDLNKSYLVGRLGRGNQIIQEIQNKMIKYENVPPYLPTRPPYPPFFSLQGPITRPPITHHNILISDNPLLQQFPPPVSYLFLVFEQSLLCCLFVNKLYVRLPCRSPRVVRRQNYPVPNYLQPWPRNNQPNIGTVITHHFIKNEVHRKIYKNNTVVKDVRIQYVYYIN